jgi:hypothetical protein
VPVTQRSGALPLHLYVSDAGSAQVFRFPIVGGVVGASPDNILKVSGGEPGAMALDSHDNLYVSVEQFNNVAIQEFAPGASGKAAPTRSITTEASSLAVDSNGYIYATGNPSPQVSVSVFAPNATGSATPVATFSGSADVVTLDSSNTLYIGHLGGKDPYIEAYMNAATGSPVLVRRICAEESVLSLATAAMNSESTLYAGEVAGGNSYGRTRVWTGTASRACPGLSRQIKLSGVYRSQFYQTALALDVQDQALFMATTSLLPKIGPVYKVYEVKALDFAPQKALATLGATMAKPIGVAVGP